ncbi:hypothetical protein B0T26DRAFT_427734 [Lasiosphaeria miniovina]|uniref:Uncharacterized protein n=1 Tax=Lasiosphaeria miniovina TaxID=1954250 RepID=A0AA40A5Y4_9PEZI|nr:uncharacterized protein B0T26DRAFT_427734 [Lasiosphaeria miniovina]KAK0709874.1 hypothetical protein B0T26DRAFT_427734 [Lasiosphaeria miniovina]
MLCCPTGSPLVPLFAALMSNVSRLVWCGLLSGQWAHQSLPWDAEAPVPIGDGLRCVRVAASRSASSGPAANRLARYGPLPLQIYQTVSKVNGAGRSHYREPLQESGAPLGLLSEPYEKAQIDRRLWDVMDRSRCPHAPHRHFSELERREPPEHCMVCLQLHYARRGVSRCAAASHTWVARLGPERGL